jgi:hypothetical protein
MADLLVITAETGAGGTGAPREVALRPPGLAGLADGWLA